MNSNFKKDNKNYNFEGAQYEIFKELSRLVNLNETKQFLNIWLFSIKILKIIEKIKIRVDFDESSFSRITNHKSLRCQKKRNI